MDVRKNIQAFHDRCDHVRVLRRELCAVLPVRLIAVVLARIMRGGDVDARDAVQVAQGKRQLRRRAQFVKQVDRDIRRRQHGSCRPGELLRVVAAVIGDDHAGGGFALAADQLCQRLRCVGDCMGIHGVHACFHDAAQSGSAEGQVVCEAQAQFVIVVLNGEEFCLLVCRQAVGCQPAVVLFHVFFHTVFLSGCYFGLFWGEGGARRFWLPDCFATVGVRRGAQWLWSPGLPALSMLFCPHPPSPLPRRGRGRLLVYFAGGWRPRHPCAEPLTALNNHAIQATPRGAEPGRHWLRSITNSRKVLGGLGDSFKSPPAHLCPLHPGG